MKGRKATQSKKKLNMILYGATFTGKSTLASQLAYFKNEDGSPFKVLYIDAETGGIDNYIDEIEANGADLNNIYIIYTQSLTEVRQCISRVKNHEVFYEFDDEGNETDEIVKDADGNDFHPDAIVIDGATILNMSLQQGLIEFSKKRNKVKANAAGLVGDERLVKIEGAGLEIKDYNTIKFKGQELILDLMSSGVHSIVTCREAEEKKSVKTPEGQITSVSTGKFMSDGFKGIEYNANTVLRTFIDKETGQVCAFVEKDRSGVHAANEIIEDPTLLDWQVIVQKNKGLKDYVIKNDLTNAVETEQELYSREVMGAVGEPVSVDEMKTESTNGVKSAADLRGEISAIIKGMSPVGKQDMKKALTEAGLPTAFSKLEDVEILKQILAVISK